MPSPLGTHKATTYALHALAAYNRSFFFGSLEPAALTPIEIAHVVMEAGSVAGQQKPFIQNLTSSVKKPRRSLTLSALRQKKGKSVTGLFDSPALTTRWACRW